MKRHSPKPRLVSGEQRCPTTDPVNGPNCPKPRTPSAAEVEAVAILRSIQWRGNRDWTSCPLCGNYPEQGHAIECQIRKALARRRRKP